MNMNSSDDLSFLDIFEAIPDVMGLQDTERRIIRYNQAGCEYLGMTQEEVEGRLCYELIGRNTPCPVCATVEAVATGNPTSIVKHVPENGTWLNVRAYPIKNREGKVFRVVEHLRDITESKVLQMELERLNNNLENQVEARTEELKGTIEELTLARDRLIESEKLSALGRMVAGISHEVNTPLGVAITSASYIRDLLNQSGLEPDAEFDDSDYGRLPKDFMGNLFQACSLVNRNLERAGDLMSGFKRIAADQTSERLREIDPVDYLEDLVASLYHETNRRRLNISVDGENGYICTTYPGAISQVVSNLIMNSMNHAYPDGGPGTVIIRVVSRDDGKPGFQILYSDDGCGMTPETVRRLYEPFFSTGVRRDGIGLGMNIVYNLVVGKLGGQISCDSAPGEGTRYTIILPEMAED